MKKQQSAVSSQQSAKKTALLTKLQAALLFIFTIILVIFSYFPLPIAHYLSPVASVAAASLDETVARVETTFAGINDIQGSFAQTSYIKDIEETQKYAGTFFVKKPAFMMWEYEKPRDEKIIIRDTDTWIYKKAENQVIKTKFSREAFSQVPIAMLGSFDHLRDDFNVSMPDENALQLMPKQKMGFIKTIVMEVSPDDFPVKMFTIIDTYGNIIMIELTSVKPNPGLDDSLFTFTPPPGAEVYDMSQ
jgi:outer membrane lipoprotein carrier protein